jgi:hypothetical protein
MLEHTVSLANRVPKTGFSTEERRFKFKWLAKNLGHCDGDGAVVGSAAKEVVRSDAGAR